MVKMEPQVTRETKDYELQSRGSKKTFSQDNSEQQLDVLSRLGKLPVLKVPSCPQFEYNCVVLIYVAQFRVHINPRFYVYYFDNLGSGIHVSGNRMYQRRADIVFLKHIRCFYPQVNLAQDLAASEQN